jgi:hypothetical protein
MKKQSVKSSSDKPNAQQTKQCKCGGSLGNTKGDRAAAADGKKR